MPKGLDLQQGMSRDRSLAVDLEDVNCYRCASQAKKINNARKERGGPQAARAAPAPAAVAPRGLEAVIAWSSRSARSTRVPIPTIMLSPQCINSALLLDMRCAFL